MSKCTVASNNSSSVCLYDVFNTFFKDLTFPAVLLCRTGLSKKYPKLKRLLQCFLFVQIDSNIVIWCSLPQNVVFTPAVAPKKTIRLYQRWRLPCVDQTWAAFLRIPLNLNSEMCPSKNVVLTVTAYQTFNKSQITLSGYIRFALSDFSQICLASQSKYRSITKEYVHYKTNQSAEYYFKKTFSLQSHIINT